jgi:hypothetical protein
LSPVSLGCVFALLVFEDSAVLDIESSLLVCLFSTPWLLGQLCTGCCFVGHRMCLVIYSLSFMPCRRAFLFCPVVLFPHLPYHSALCSCCVSVVAVGVTRRGIVVAGLLHRSRIRGASLFEISWLCQLLSSGRFVAGTTYRWTSSPARK